MAVHARNPYSQHHVHLDRPAPGLLSKLLAFLTSALMIGLGLIFSLVAAAVVAVGSALFGGWLWWKTRALRRHLRTGPAAAKAEEFTEGFIIEGEVIRNVDQGTSGQSQPLR